MAPHMSDTKVSRRGRGEDAIYFATAKNQYVGSVSLGYGPDGKRIRRKVFGKTKQEVRDRLTRNVSVTVSSARSAAMPCAVRYRLSIFAYTRRKASALSALSSC